MNSRHSFVRATAACAVLLAPVALTACGSKDDEASATPSSTATSTTTTTTTTATSEAPATSEAAPSEENKPEDTGEKPPADQPPADTVTPDAPAPEPAPAPIPAPAGIDLNAIPPVTPVAGGQPGTPEDEAAVRGVMETINSGKTTHEVLNTLKNSTCSRVLDQNGGAAAFDISAVPDIPVTMLPDYAPTTVGAINDVVVDGDEMSAQVTTNSGGQERSGTVRFAREGGQWKLCD
ncbi:hypothetical protein [Corynebacterium aquilae]|uniref:hypothetical protein n=1 Tax=Corynebacterium aquilae TaxID=203263 RepID=UPI0009519347|nr:hypothetical protein [Corynebacterium aquilae]